MPHGVSRQMRHPPNTILLMMRNLSRRATIALFSVLGILGLLAGTITGYSVYYSDHALPGVTIAGHSVRGMTADEITVHLQERLDKATVTLNVEGTVHVASFADLGFAVDIPSAVRQAMAPSTSLRGQIRVPFKGETVALTHSFDEEAFSTYTASLLPKDAAKITDASVSFNEAAGRFEVKPGQSGQRIHTDALRFALDSSISALEPIELSVAVSSEEPRITTESAQKAADSAQKFIATNITLSDGIDSFSPTAAQKAAWVTLKATDSGYEEPTVNSEKVAAWVKDTAKTTNVDPVPGVNNVNSRGDVVSVHEAGTTGWVANNVDTVVKAVDKAFRERTDFSGSFDYDEKKPEMTTRLVADGAGAHIYAAAPGEKWIDLNLATATVTAYEGATVVKGPVPMVPGAPETPTVTGTFRVWHQNPLQTMRGFNADGTKYETPNVPWATYFFQDYAFHGAPWRSSFGWSGPGGSHGCVNMPVEDAEWIYNWASIGTIVVSHY